MTYTAACILGYKLHVLNLRFLSQHGDGSSKHAQVVVHSLHVKAFKKLLQLVRVTRAGCPIRNTYCSGETMHDLGILLPIQFVACGSQDDSCIAAASRLIDMK